jgi:hypothetical protein
VGRKKSKKYQDDNRSQISPPPQAQKINDTQEPIAHEGIDTSIRKRPKNDSYTKEEKKTSWVKRHRD